MPKQLQPCGTIGAYQRHRNHGEPVCDACRAASAAYSAARRASSPAAPAELAYSRVQSRALRQLAREYPTRFREIRKALAVLDQTAPDRNHRKDST